MINETILYLPHTDCKDERIRPYAKELGINVNWDPDLYLGTPLKKMFNSVIRLDIGESYLGCGVMETNKKIIDLVKEHSPKYVIWPSMTYEIMEETFQEIRKMGCYVVVWFFDDETRFDNYSRWWTPYIDYAFTADKLSVLRYQQLGIKAYHLLVTGEPDNFKPASSQNGYDISFVGSKYVANREEMVKRLYDENGINISTFGKGWENGFVSHDEMVRIFFNSKINICFTKSYAGDRNQLKGKIFDIMMCGGFLLCEYVEGIEDFFEIDSEIVCFKDYSEAVEKIKYYLMNDEERSRIAEAGRIRVVGDYSQSRLLEKLFLDIETDTKFDARNISSSVSFTQMPKNIRIAHAQYHLRWSNVLKKTGFDRKFWKNEYDLASKYVPLFSFLEIKHKLISIIHRVINALRSKKYFNKKIQYEK